MGPFTYESRKIGSVIYFLLKERGPIIYLAALFGTHIRTMSYMGSYPPNPHPPPRLKNMKESKSDKRPDHNHCDFVHSDHDLCNWAGTWNSGTGVKFGQF